MEPARKYPRPIEPQEEEPEAANAERLAFETKLGKSLFYLTVAVAIWFFYWLNGINCPCP
jgi:hypothetical protein